MSSVLNRVRQAVSSPTGQGGPLVLSSSAFSNAYTTISGAGGVDQSELCYIIEENSDFELQRGLWTLSSNQLVRNTPIISNISGSTGITKMSLAGNATIRVIIDAAELNGFRGIRSVSGTTDTIHDSDGGWAIVYSNASAIAVALGAPGTNTFRNGWETTIKNVNTGVMTITATGATITSDGASSSALVLNQYESAFLFSNGTNYYAQIIRNPIWSAQISLSSAQQLQASNNLLVASGAGAQTLSASVQEQIRANQGSAVGFPDVVIEEQQSSGTSVASATAGTYATRTLNTQVRSNAAIVTSLSSGQFTLAAGTYYIAWSAPAFLVGGHKTKLQNITAGSAVQFGTSEYATNNLADSCMTRSFGAALVTIASATVYAIQHVVANAKTVNGFGVATSQGTEIYSRLEIWKLG